MASLHGPRSARAALNLEFDLTVGSLRALQVRFRKHDERTREELRKAAGRFHRKVKATTKVRCAKDTGYMSRNIETREISSDGYQQETGWWRDTFETTAKHAKFRFYAPYPELRVNSLGSSFYQHADSFNQDVKDILKRGEARMRRGRP